MKKLDCTVINQSFTYAAVIAILLSGNTWIQIPKIIQKKEIKYIVNESNIHLIIGDEKIKYIKKNIKQINFKEIINKNNSKDLYSKCPFDEKTLHAHFLHQDYWKT